MEEFKKLKTVLENSFNKVDLSDRPTYISFYLTFDYDKSTNMKLRIPTEISLFSFLSFGFYKDDYFKDKTRIPIRVSVSFVYYEVKTNSYPLKMPRETNWLWCPRNTESIGILYWNATTNRFSVGKRMVNLVEYLRIELKSHQLPLKPIIGIIERYQRLLKWYILSPFFEIIFHCMQLLFYIFTGKKAKPKKEMYQFLYHETETELETETVSQEKENTVDFFGLKVKLPPLISYCSVHFIVFSIMFFLKFKPDYIKNIFSNTFLTAIYVIISYFFMEFVIGNTLFWVCSKIYNIYLKTKNPKSKSYVT